MASGPLSLSARIEHWPLGQAFTISRGSKTEAIVVVAEVSDGVHTGRGECVPYPRYAETPEGTLEAITAMSNALRRGMDRAALQAAMPAGAARNAVDCALWDFAAKAAGLRVWDLIGLPEPRPLKTAYTISLGAPDVMAADAAKAALRPLLKVKLGGDGDEARIAAVRRAAPNAELVVDANESWSPHNLERNLAACAAGGVTLIEQPLPSGKDDLLGAIKRPLVVCADESVHDRASLEALRGKYDAVNIKLDKTGGLTEALAMSEMARARLAHHDRLHGLDLAVDGAVADGGPTGRRDRSRWPVAAGSRPRRRIALRRPHRASAGERAVGVAVLRFRTTS